MNLLDNPAVEWREFCSWCPNQATGTLTFLEQDGQEIDLPVCGGCVRVIAEEHSDKMEGLDSLSDG